MKYLISLVLSLCISTPILAIKPHTPSLRDKIGQMLLIGFDGKQVSGQSDIIQQIEKNNLGGVILFDHDFLSKTDNKNIENPAQVKQLNEKLQFFTKQAQIKHHRAILPLLISVDYEGGKVVRLQKKYGFPATISPAEAGKSSTETAKSAAKSMAITLKQTGFNLNFAPSLDLNINPDNPVIGKKNRSFASDPKTVTRYASIYSHEFLRQNIQCAYKHFPGHGSSTKDSHLDFVDVSNTWKSIELKPYQQLLQSDHACGVVMTAHIVNRQLDKSGLPATLSHTILTGILRNQLHFKGVIITDDLHMKAIADNYTLEKALVLTINAGADMLIFGNNLGQKAEDPAHIIDIIEARVRTGEISEDRINEAYQRIVGLKKSLKSLRAL